MGKIELPHTKHDDLLTNHSAIEYQMLLKVNLD